jgi:two-component sensor histidine kinase
MRFPHIPYRIDMCSFITRLVRWLLTGLLMVAGQMPVFSQNQVVDSLLQITRTTPTDTGRIDAWLSIVPEIMENEPAQGIRYGLQAKAGAEKIKDPFRKGRALQAIGVCYDYKGDLDSCLYYLKAAHVQFTEIGRADWQANITSDIALAYFLRGNYELALRNHLQALELRKQFGNKSHISKTLNNIGLVYKARKDYTNAIRYYGQSIAIKETLKDERGLVNTYMNIGSMYQSRDQYDSSLYYAQKCLALAEKLHLEADIAGARGNMGQSLLKMNRLQDAEKELLASKSLAEKVACRNCLWSVYQGLGNIYMQRKEFSRAINLLTTGLQLSASNQRTQQMLAFYTDLSDCYRRMGDFRQALQYQDSTASMSQALLNEENLRQMNEMTAVYESAEKEKQIERLNIEKVSSIAEARSRKQERNYFLVSSLLFLALAMVAYKAYTSNKKKKELLNRQNAIIEQSLADKEVLLKEIHHRVKNNLQLVSSLLSLQADYIKDAHALDAVKESRNRVHAMALIHQNLYQEEDLTGIKVDDYISKLCDNLFNSYNIKPGKLNLVKELQDLHLDVEIVVPLGLMLNELITNCLKYAFPGHRQGTIKIILLEHDHCLRLCVYDNGVGLPHHFSIHDSVTFGFKMIKAFMQKMKGDMKVYTEDGTKVELTMTNYKPAAHE